MNKDFEKDVVSFAEEAAAEEYFGWNSLSFESREELFCDVIKRRGVIYRNGDERLNVSKDEIENYASNLFASMRGDNPIGMSLVWGERCVVGVKISFITGYSETFERGRFDDLSDVFHRALSFAA